MNNRKPAPFFNANIKVLIVEDHEMFREGLGILISNIQHLTLFGTAPSGREMKRLMKDRQPDIILMDIRLAGEDGIELTEYVRDHYPEVKVIALTMNDNPNTIIKMLSAGAAGYLLKSASKHELVEAIESVLSGKEYYSPEVAFRVINKISVKEKNHPPGPEFSGFTTREIEVIRMVCDGKSNYEIADKLHLSIRTVEKHRFNISRKMNVKSSAEMIIYAIKNNLYEV